MIGRENLYTLPVKWYFNILTPPGAAIGRTSRHNDKVLRWVSVGALVSSAMFWVDLHRWAVAYSGFTRVTSWPLLLYFLQGVNPHLVAYFRNLHYIFIRPALASDVAWLCLVIDWLRSAPVPSSCSQLSLPLASISHTPTLGVYISGQNMAMFRRPVWIEGGAHAQDRFFAAAAETTHSPPVSTSP